MNTRFWAVAAASAIVLTLHLAVPSAAGAGGTWLNLYNGIALAGVLIAAAALVKFRPTPAASWWAIVATLWLWFAGDLAYELTGGDPTISAADVFYLGGYLSLAYGLVTLIRAQPGHRDRDQAIDIGLAAIGASYAVWELVIRPLWSEPGASVAGRIMTSAYPVADVVILVLVIHLLLAPGVKNLAKVGLFVGVVALFTADTIYAVMAQTAEYGANTHQLDTLWLVTYVAFALACLYQPTGDRPQEDVGGAMLVSQVVIGVGALLTVPLVIAITNATGSFPDVVGIVAASTALTALAVARFVRLARGLEQARNAIEARERYYRALTVNANDITVVIDDDDRVIDSSRAVALPTGGAVADRFRANALLLVHPSDRQQVTTLLAEARSHPGRPHTGEFRLRPFDGTERWIELRCTSLDDEVIKGVIINAREVTDRKRMEADLEHQVLHDALTGLANRTLFRDRIDHALARMERDGGEVAVIFCDLDGFKSVNASLGQVGGDELLRRVGARLAAAVRAGDTVSRIGGDEFAILIDAVGDLSGSTARAVARIRDSVTEPIEINGTPLVVTWCMGIAIADADTTGSDALLRNADLALFHARSEGRGTQATYEPNMGEEAANRRQLEADLRHAVERDELILHYQPLVELDTGRIRGFEALVRWMHPRRGLLMPGDFIGIAEDSGLIVEIGDWVLRTACATAAEWTAIEPNRPQLEMSVNLSARQLADPTLADRVIAAVNDTGMNPHRLVLELTESVLVEKADDANAHLTKLSAIGIRLAIDDFGTGYSSFAYLQQFQVDIIKIDRGFVSRIDVDDSIPPLIRGMLELSRSLGAECIAEGIEEPHQALALTGAACPLGQGYLFSRPVGHDAASALALGSRDVATAEPLPSQP